MKFNKSRFQGLPQVRAIPDMAMDWEKMSLRAALWKKIGGSHGWEAEHDPMMHSCSPKQQDCPSPSTCHWMMLAWRY